MAKLTVSDIKRQIAALEAKAARLAEGEMKASVSKVRALMESLGVTVEHLSAKASRAAKTTKAAIVGKSAPGKKALAKRTGAGVAKYRDPKSGATWTGFGRAPSWIASAKNRDRFLIEKVQAAEAVGVTASAPAKKAAKEAVKKVAKSATTQVKAAAKKVTRVAKAKATRGSAPAKKRAAKSAAPAKKAASRKAVSKRAAGKVERAAPSAPSSPAEAQSLT
jgi:DNA-binding protein H-NS